MKMRTLLLFVCWAIMAPLRAQSPVDSLYLLKIEQAMDSMERAKNIADAVHKYENRLLNDEMRFHFNENTILLRGILQTATNHSFIQNESRFAQSNFNPQDYAVASLPFLSAWTLKMLGVESRSKFRRMFTANAIATVLTIGTVEGLKQLVYEERPNGKDSHSFPSGHAAIAFMGAAILDREFGHHSPWISVGGYTAATATEWLRLRHNEHYVNDIFTGAGIGLVATNLAYFLTDRIYGEDEINRPRLYRSDIVRLGRFLEQPISLSLIAGSEITSRQLTLDGIDFKTSSVYMAGLQYSYFFNSRWALDVETRISTVQVKPDLHDAGQPNTDIVANTLSQYHVDLGLRYSQTLGLNTRLAFRVFGGESYTRKTIFHAQTPSLPTIVVPHSWNPEVGAGISLEFMTTRNYVTGFSIDYLHHFSDIFPNRCLFSSYWKILL